MADWIYDRSRYQLDFRNPEVIAHANEVIDRVVNEYGVGYIKMDYNIEPGIGTELDADSFGEGLLAHERAYLAWLDTVFGKIPGSCDRKLFQWRLAHGLCPVVPVKYPVYQ